MARSDTVYVCQSCGGVHAKWAGRCDACGSWNTLVEESGASAPLGTNAKRPAAPPAVRDLSWWTWAAPPKIPNALKPACASWTAWRAAAGARLGHSSGR